MEKRKKANVILRRQDNLERSVMQTEKITKEKGCVMMRYTRCCQIQNKLHAAHLAGVERFERPKKCRGQNPVPLPLGDTPIITPALFGVTVLQHLIPARSISNRPHFPQFHTNLLSLHQTLLLLDCKVVQYRELQCRLSGCTAMNLDCRTYQT